MPDIGTYRLTPIVAGYATAPRATTGVADASHARSGVAITQSATWQ
ncbi:MAG: hypothetical protein ACREPT_00510 [Rudaea sp.]